MDASLKQTLASMLLTTGCLFSAASHAYSAAEDADAQDREVKAAYDRGYKAAKEELAREAATRGAAAASPPAPAAPVQKTASVTPRKPILDIKHVYSETSDIETVREVPVTSTPLPEQPGAQSASPTAARIAQPQPEPQAVVRRAAVAPSDELTDSASPRYRQPVQRAVAQPRNSSTVLSAARSPQQNAMAAEELADDDGYDADPPRAAQVYSTGPQYARPPVQYAPPPVATRPAPQPYGYAQPSTYAPARPYAYYAPPARGWGDGYQPVPYAGRWYWSPEYGRWLYY